MLLYADAQLKLVKQKAVIMFQEEQDRLENLGIYDDNVLDILINNPELTDDELKEIAEGF